MSSGYIFLSAIALHDVAELSQEGNQLTVFCIGAIIQAVCVWVRWIYRHDSQKKRKQGYESKNKNLRLSINYCWYLCGYFN